MSCPVLDTSNATLNSSGGLLINGVISRAGMGGYDPNFKMQQVEAWSLSVQQQLQSNLIVELNYSGTEAHHLMVFQNDANRFAGDLIQNNNTADAAQPQLCSNGVGQLRRQLRRTLRFRGGYTVVYPRPGLPGNLHLWKGVGRVEPGSITGQWFHYLGNRLLCEQRSPCAARTRRLRHPAAVLGRRHLGCSQQLFQRRAQKHHWRMAIRRQVDRADGLPFTVVNGACFAPICSGNAALVNNQCPAGTTIVGNSGGNYNADGS